MIVPMRLFLSRQRPFSSQRSVLLALALFFLALLPRLAALGEYITPDELNWVHRSVLFHQALGRGDWAETLTTGHPGVLTTWLGAAGLQIQLWLQPSDSAAYEWITRLAWLAPENTAAFPQLATFLSAGRMAVTLANSLGLLVIFALARRLVGFWPAAATMVLLALDPFVAGLSGLLHVDGLMTTLTTISLLALALIVQDIPRASWRLTAVSGAAAGGAILAKSAALTLLPFAALAFGVALLAWRSRWSKLLGLGLVWLLALLGVQFLLLPALWVSPVGSYETIIGTIFHETEEVLPPLFFLGQVSQAHGAAFYPVALLFRLNPLVLVGLVLGGWLGWRDNRFANWRQRPSRLLLLGWPVFFILVLSLATKKYDRYLLPALPPLFLLGTLGWHLLLQKRPSWTRPVTIGGTLLALVYVAAAVPYLLNVYNPLVGGRLTARYVMPLGWGESVSAAAQWLAEQPEAAEKTAVAGIGPAFAPFFPGKTLLSDGNNWQEADYVVETLAGRQHSSFGPQHLRAGQTLLHTLRFDGQDQAWIFAVDEPIDPERTWIAQTSRFGDQIGLVASATAVHNDQLSVWVQWQLLQPTTVRYSVQVGLLDENGQLWSQMEMPLLNEVYFYPEHWRPNQQPVWRYDLTLPPGLPPARYRVELALFAAETGAQLPVLAADGRFAGVVQPLAELDLKPTPLLQTAPLALAAEPQPLLAGDLLFLGQAALSESVLTGGGLTVELFWQGTAVLPDDLQLQFFVDDLLLATLPLSRFATGLWQVNQVIHEKYAVPIPSDAAAGMYELRAAVVSENGRPVNTPQIELGTINIFSPDRLFSLPGDIPQTVNLAFGDLAALRGYALLSPIVAPGEPVRLTLYWQVVRQPEDVLSTFVHLVGPDGQIAVQGDQWPGGLPSTTWVGGQVIIDEYAIQLPEDALPGTYQIVLGLYSPANGLRLPILEDDGQSLPNDQFVLPLPLEVVGR